MSCSGAKIAERGPIITRACPPIAAIQLAHNGEPRSVVYAHNVPADVGAVKMGKDQGKGFLARHEGFLKDLKEKDGKVGLLFVGEGLLETILEAKAIPEVRQISRGQIISGLTLALFASRRARGQLQLDHIVGVARSAVEAPAYPSRQGHGAHPGPWRKPKTASTKALSSFMLHPPHRLE